MKWESQSFSDEINVSLDKHDFDLQYFFGPRSKLLNQYSVSSMPTLYINTLYTSIPKLLESTTFMKFQKLANQLAYI